MMTNEELAAILQKVTDPDPSERRMAAESLSEADERAIYPLIKALRDENTGVQDAAMRSIVTIGGEVSAYMTLPLLRESPFLRNTARIILRQIGQPAVPLLHSLLADKDDDVRTFAVDLISDIGWCDYPADIARLLEADPNQNVRASAARAIGVLGYHDAIPALTAALKDNEWVCFSVLETLALLRDESCVEALLALLGSPSETLRYSVIETLGKIGSPRSSEALLGRIAKASPFEKSAIVKSLVQIGVTPSMAEIGDLLLEMFNTGEWEDRLVALTGLADCKDRRAIPAILEIAGSLDPSEPESEERLIAVKQALAQFGCQQALIDALNDPAEPRFRGKVIAVEVIGELQCAEAVPALIAVLETDLREVRRAAIMALAEIGGDEAIGELRRRINDRDGHVRNASISTLGRRGDKNSFTALLNALAVENYKDVLEETVRALLLIDAPALYARMDTLSDEVRELLCRYADNVETLLTLSRDTVPGVRLAALSGLGRLQDSRAAKRLAESVRDNDPEVRKAAIAALGSLNSGIAEIKAALKDADLWVRVAAARALGDSGAEEAAKSILPLLYDRETPVVLAAIDALVRLGSAEAAALNTLQNHPDAEVRERAGQALEQI